MSLFDGKPQEVNIPRQKEKLPIIISASRMTDMPRYYPQELINSVKTRIEKGINIHTLVLWTKHPGCLLMNPLKEFLLSLKQEGIQLYLQCTVTGLGKKVVGKCYDGKDLILEPNAPTMEEAIASLPQVIDLLGKPQRLRLRIDKKGNTNLAEPRKREMCGCTHSVDIGGWPPKTCFTACQYCYAKSSS